MDEAQYGFRPQRTMKLRQWGYFGRSFPSNINHSDLTYELHFFLIKKR